MGTPQYAYYIMPICILNCYNATSNGSTDKLEYKCVCMETLTRFGRRPDSWHTKPTSQIYTNPRPTVSLSPQWLGSAASRGLVTVTRSMEGLPATNSSLSAEAIHRQRKHPRSRVGGGGSINFQRFPPEIGQNSTPSATCSRRTLWNCVV